MRTVICKKCGCSFCSQPIGSVNPDFGKLLEKILPKEFFKAYEQFLAFRKDQEEELEKLCPFCFEELEDKIAGNTPNFKEAEEFFGRKIQEIFVQETFYDLYNN